MTYRIGFLALLVLILSIRLLTGCAFNRPVLAERTTSTNGAVTYRSIRITTFAMWPATTAMERQLAQIGHTLGVGTDNLQQQTLTSNLVELLKAMEKKK